MSNKVLGFVSIVLAVVSAVAAPVRSGVSSAHIGRMEVFREPPEPLPDGCVAVEYLESDGTAYVNTGIKMERTYGFLIDFTTFSGAGKSYAHYVCGGYLQSTYNFFSFYQWANSGRALSVRTYSASSTSSLYALNCGTTPEQRHVMISDPTGAFYLDGVLVHDGEAYGFPEGNTDNLKPPFGIFNVTRIGGNPYMTTPASKPLRVHRCALFNGEEFLFDGIPVRYTGDGRGYIYDRVSGLLFGTASDVDFGIGPDKVW